MTAASAGPLLRLRDVGKQYAKVEGNGGRFRVVSDLLLRRRPRNPFRALEAVSFEVEAGESLAVIGENGAGKSTLLKIVAGVIAPTTGEIEVGGRVGALLELGSGFHPEYSGLENIELAAALLGISPGDLAGRRDAIVAFADIGERIHDPIKHYSSGMIVRLGFAVATALKPDILVTDEVLAVGDESFQKKCIAWIERYIEHGGTLLLCSHSLYHVQKLCRRAIWLKDGRIERSGTAVEVSQAYLAYHEEKRATDRRVERSQVLPSSGAHGVRSLVLEPAERVAMGDTVFVRAHVDAPRNDAPSLALSIVRADETPIYRTVSPPRSPAPDAGGSVAFAVSLARLPLLPGRYFIRAEAIDACGDAYPLRAESAFWVTGDTRELGLVRMEHRWAHATSGEPASIGTIG